MRVISGPVQPGTALTADRSLTFAENMVPVSGSAVRQLILTLFGLTWAEVTRITVKAGSVPFVDCTPAYLRAFFNFIAKGAQWAAADIAGSLYFPGNTLLGEKPADNILSMGGPPGQLMRIEIQKSAVPAAGNSAQLHQLIEDRALAQAWSYFVASSANIPTPAITFNVPITTPGLLAGLVIPDVNQVTLLRIFGPDGLMHEFTSAAAIIEHQKQYRAAGAIPLGDPLYISLAPTPVIPGRTRIEVSTSALFAGPTAELGIHTIVPLQQPAA